MSSYISTIASILGSIYVRQTISPMSHTLTQSDVCHRQIDVFFSSTKCSFYPDVPETLVNKNIPVFTSKEPTHSMNKWRRKKLMLCVVTYHYTEKIKINKISHKLNQQNSHTQKNEAIAMGAKE